MIEITDELIIERAYQYYKNKEFPYPILNPGELLILFKKLQKAKSKIVKSKGGFFKRCNEIEIQPIGDPQLANSFHPHIWQSKAVGTFSPTESYCIEKKLRKAIRLSLKYEGDIHNMTLLRYLKLVDGTQMCSNFRPTAAKAVYDYFDAHNVMDMSTGYGGRLIGFIASKSTGFYFGVDPSKRTCEANMKITKFFGAEDRTTIVCKPFENVKDIPTVDLAFTSPPYFSKEIYDDSPKQSRERYPEYNAWLKGFLVQLVIKTRTALTPKGIMALNVNDVTIKGTRYPLLDDTIKTAEENGFVHVQTIKLKFSGFGKNMSKFKFEPLLIFKKR